MTQWGAEHTSFTIYSIILSTSTMDKTSQNRALNGLRIKTTTNGSNLGCTPKHPGKHIFVYLIILGSQSPEINYIFTKLIRRFK